MKVLVDSTQEYGPIGPDHERQPRLPPLMRELDPVVRAAGQEVVRRMGGEDSVAGRRGREGLILLRIEVNVGQAQTEPPFHAAMGP